MIAAFSLGRKPYIAFERLAGDLYSTVIEESDCPLCYSSTQKIAQQIAQGLARMYPFTWYISRSDICLPADLHKLGIVHGDIKVDNILLYNSEHEVIKIESKVRYILDALRQLTFISNTVPEQTQRPEDQDRRSRGCYYGIGLNPARRY